MLVLVILYVAWYLFKPVKEGFQSGGALFEQMAACPALDSTIRQNKQLLEGYTERNACTSMSNTQEILKYLTASFDEYECESFLAENKAKAKAKVEVEPKEEPKEEPKAEAEAS